MTRENQLSSTRWWPAFCQHVADSIWGSQDRMVDWRGIRVPRTSLDSDKNQAKT